jgi:hypothetical protein
MLHVKLPLDTRKVMQNLAALGGHGAYVGRFRRAKVNGIVNGVTIILICH